MEILETLWGSGNDLDALQMSCRGVAAFFIALILIRISGRRSFGIRTALDNIIVILLGAILSRAVVGASPFGSVVATCFVVVVLHRIFAWLLVRNRTFGRIIEGEKILLYENNQFLMENMKKGLVCEEDIMQGVREAIQLGDLAKVDKIFIERNGEISVVKKSEQ